MSIVKTLNVYIIWTMLWLSDGLTHSSSTNWRFRFLNEQFSARNAHFHAVYEHTREYRDMHVARTTLRYVVEGSCRSSCSHTGSAMHADPFNILSKSDWLVCDSSIYHIKKILSPAVTIFNHSGYSLIHIFKKCVLFETPSKNNKIKCQYWNTVLFKGGWGGIRTNRNTINTEY